MANRKAHIAYRSQDGQIMFFTVLVLAAVFLSATVIAGLLMTSQLGQLTRIADSTRAIFAADAAIERGLFKVFRCNPAPVVPDTGNWNIGVFCASAGNQEPVAPPPIAPFYNGATYRLTIESDDQDTAELEQCGSGKDDPSLANSDTVICIKATGRAGKSARAFEINFQ